MGKNISSSDLAILKEALSNLENSYSTYSKCKVSCIAVSAKTGKQYKGVNIENSSYPCGICAERSAIANAITAEGSDFRIAAIYVVNSTGNVFEPCGICRQTIGEFADGDAKVFVGNCDLSKTECHAFCEILPYSFSADAMK
ncbi:MAG TPA: cytidine deaminase [Spirochaetaceae bacterium]|nr:cytidine deaminase [Spirochaetaceae bacterium]